MTAETVHHVALTDVQRDMVVTFSPRSAARRVTVLVDHVTVYDDGLAFIAGTRCKADGAQRRSSRLKSYLVRPEVEVLHHVGVTAHWEG